MLVLTRKLNQQIRLGEEITVTVLQINRGTIRLGIDAPKDVRILRCEVPKKEGEPRSCPQGEDVSQPGETAAESEQIPHTHSPAVLPWGGSEPLPADAMSMLEIDIDAYASEQNDPSFVPLDDLLPDFSPSSAEQEAEEAEVYQMRLTAPLARFFPRSAKEESALYSF